MVLEEAHLTPSVLRDDADRSGRNKPTKVVQAAEAAVQDYLPGLNRLLFRNELAASRTREEVCEAVHSVRHLWRQLLSHHRAVSVHCVRVSE